MTAPFPPDCAARFQPLEELGSGGYGTVWRARDTKFDRPAAVKLLHASALGDPDQVSRFEREARVTAAIVHPHVVTVLDSGAGEGVPWIAYELLPGKSLRDRLDAGPLAPRLALTATLQVASALAAAHAAGVLHRDVKPENVLSVTDEIYKVADFGIARWAGDTRVQTATGIILGTPSYIAPEQVNGAAPSAQTDLYALGVTVYELLTGSLPFTGASPLAVLTAHVLEQPVPPSERRPGIPAHIDRLVLRALAKSPADRFASAAEMGEHVQAALDLLDASGAGGAPAPRPAPAGHPAPAGRGSGSTSRTQPVRHASQTKRTVAVPSIASAQALPSRVRTIGIALAAALGVVLLFAVALPTIQNLRSPALEEFLEVTSRHASAVRDARRRYDRSGVQDSRSWRATEFERLVGKPAVDRMRGDLPRLVRGAAALAPAILTQPEPDATALAFAGAAADLFSISRQLNDPRAEAEVAELYLRWAGTWPDRPLACLPLAITPQVERPDAARVDLQPKRFRALIGRPAPPTRHDAVLEIWVGLQARLAKMAGREDGRGGDPAATEEVHWQCGQAIMAACTKAGWPRGLSLAREVMLRFDHALVSRVNTLSLARYRVRDEAERRLLDQRQAELEAAWQDRERATAQEPEPYDVLLLATSGLELEPRVDHRRASHAHQLVDALRDRLGPRFPWLAPYIKARRIVRDTYGNHAQIERFAIPKELSLFAEHLIASPPPRPAADDLDPELAWPALLRWTDALLWAADQLARRGEPGRAGEIAQAVARRCGPALEHADFKFRSETMRKLLPANLPAPPITDK